MPMIYKGTDPTTDIKLGTVDVNDVYLGDKLVWHRNTSPLPTGYTVKDYISSRVDAQHEGQMIVTDLKNAAPTYEMDIEINSVDGWNFLVGKWASNSNAYNFNYDTYNKTGYNFWSGNSRSDVVVGQSMTTGIKYHIQMTPTRLSWTTADGAGDGYIENTSGTECTNTTLPIILFCMSITANWDYSIQYLDGFCIPVSAYADMKMYSCIISDTNTGNELAHFIPCIRNADNVVGLYDIISDKFYRSYLYNESTSGDFI